MLLCLNAVGDVIFIIALKDRILACRITAAVEFVGNECNRRAMLLVAVFKHLAMGMQTRIFWQ